jgi:hypothetical protein
MFMFEFNNLPLEEKHAFIFRLPAVDKGRFISYWKDDNLTVSLWDCDSFFAEIYFFEKDRKIIKIEGIELTDERVNLYIDYARKADKSGEDFLIDIA